MLTQNCKLRHGFAQASFQEIRRAGTTGAAGVLLATLTAGAPVSAQVPFRVARPGNGATVRETIRFTFPRTVLDEVAYLSINVDDKFRTSVAVPKVDPKGKPYRTDFVEANNRYVYILWDTKGGQTRVAEFTDPQADKEKLQQANTQLEDGPHTFEIIAHNAQGRRIGQQDLTLNVSNEGGLYMPANGIPMTLRFQVGDDRRYRQVTSVRYIGEYSENQNPNGFNNAGRRGGQFGGGQFGGGQFGGGQFGGGQFPGAGGPPPSFATGGGGAGFRPGGNTRGNRRGAQGGPPSGFGGRRGGGQFPGGGGGRFGGGQFPGGAGAGQFGGGAGFQPQARPTGPFAVPVQDVRAEYERSTEDAVGSGLYFLRDKVTDGTIIAGNGAAALLNAIYDFKSRYRLVQTTGTVRDNGVASAARPGAYVALPIPTLGGGRRRKNDTWETRTPVLLEWATLDTPPTVSATNRLVGLEWQDGYQTAKVEQTYNGPVDMPIYGGAATMKGARIKMNRTIWLAWQSGRIIRTETLVELEGDGPASAISAMVPGASLGGGGLSGGIGGVGGFPGGAGGFPGAGFSGGGPPSFAGRPGGGFGGPQGLGGLRGGGGDDGDLGGSGFGGRFGAGGGIGGLQQQGEEPLVPAKFRSVTTVTLKKGTATTQTASLR